MLKYIVFIVFKYYAEILYDYDKYSDQVLPKYDNYDFIIGKLIEFNVSID